MTVKILFYAFLYFKITNDWEQRKLGEMAESFTYGLNVSAKKFDGKHKYLRITDIDDTNNQFNKDNLTSPNIDYSTAISYKLEYGDLLFARTGASVGKTYLYRITDGLVYFAGFLIRAKILDDFDPEFIFQNTLTSQYKRFIKVTSQRSGQPGVNAHEYSMFIMRIPSLDEQYKVSTLMNKIDNTITLHQREQYETFQNF